jgi:hypothetical protein
VIARGIEWRRESLRRRVHPFELTLRKRPPRRAQGAAAAAGAGSGRRAFEARTTSYASRCGTERARSRSKEVERS